MTSHHMENAPTHTSLSPAHRLHTNELEIGITDAVQKHIARNVVPARPVSQRKLNFEHARPRWLREMAAEATGVFFYVFCGIASQASFQTNDMEPIFGSILQIGLSYAFGISFAIICCGATSGGHFNPAVTICLAIWQGFPWKKVPYYIFAQIFGSFMAGLMVVGMYHPQLEALKLEYLNKGLSPNFAGGPGAVLCSFPLQTQTTTGSGYGYLFFIEFFVDSFIGIVIWAVLDPANPFVAPCSAPFTIGLAYAAMIWGFADVTISTNLARDLGTRIVAAIFYGGDAFNKYSAISILVNVPATIFATTYYEILMRDSMQKIAAGHGKHEDGDEGLVRHLKRSGTIEEGVAAGILRKAEVDGTGYSSGYSNCSTNVGLKHSSPV